SSYYIRSYEYINKHPAEIPPGPLIYLRLCRTAHGPSSRERGPDCGDGVGRARAVRAAGLGHVRPAAAALPADGGRGEAHEVDGGEAADEIVGDADHDAGLAVVGRADEDDDARTERRLA